uniref:Uncharacterized protein n=1 Tax=Onchocerca volvulus TaxID=6282 RepID=A0A8R1TYY6_ONCVO
MRNNCAIKVFLPLSPKEGHVLKSECGVTRFSSVTVNLLVKRKGRQRDGTKQLFILRKKRNERIPKST